MPTYYQPRDRYRISGFGVEDFPLTAKWPAARAICGQARATVDLNLRCPPQPREVELRSTDSPFDFAQGRLGRLSLHDPFLKVNLC